MAVEKIAPDDKDVRYRYGWFPKISILEELSDLYDQFLDSIGEKERRMDRWKIGLIIAGLVKIVLWSLEFVCLNF